MNGKNHTTLKNALISLAVTVIGGIIVYCVTTGNIPDLLKHDRLPEETAAPAETPHAAPGPSPEVTPFPSWQSESKSDASSEPGSSFSSVQQTVPEWQPFRSDASPSDDPIIAEPEETVTPPSGEPVIAEPDEPVIPDLSRGFVLNGDYHADGGSCYDCPDAEQIQVGLSFTGLDAPGQEINLMLPDGYWSCVLHLDNDRNVSFTCSPITLEVQLIGPDGEMSFSDVLNLADYPNGVFIEYS